MATRFCKDCKYWRPYSNCEHHSLILNNMVRGPYQQTADAYSMRTNEDLCGRGGKLWTPKLWFRIKAFFKRKS